jgi:hypothetical protein
MQARIRKADLEAFKAHAPAIRENKINPILSYVRISIEGDFGSIQKTNLKSFVLRTFNNDSEDCDFLVDENILLQFVELSSDEYINFSIQGNKIVIYDAKNKTISSTERAAMFPAIDLENIGEWVDIPKQALSAIGISAQLVFDEELVGPKSTVFVGRGAIAGSDANVGFIQYFENLPELCLRKEVAIGVSKLATCSVTSNKSYDLFKDADTMFGFSKSEVAFFDLKAIFEKEKVEQQHDFYLNKTHLEKWNNYAIRSCKNVLDGATWAAGNDRLELKIVDSKNEINIDSFISIVNGNGTFKFSPTIMNNLLKALPSEMIFFIPGTNRYYITDERKTFYAAIMLIN